MRFLTKLSALLVVIAGVLGSSAYGQLTAWQYTSRLDIQEKDGSTRSNYQVLLELNTADLIANGKMRSDGGDIRFAADCDGSNLLPYYIETPVGQLSSSNNAMVWVRVPQIDAYSITTIYFFSGNSGASTLSDQSATFPNILKITANTNLTGTHNVDWFEIQSPATVDVVDGFPLQINARRILISGVLNGNGSGYAGGAAGFNGIGPGRGKLPDVLTGNPGSGAGAYGGAGGDGGYDAGELAGLGGAAYGSATAMIIDMGSGGAGGATAAGGNGGGAVTLNGSYVEISGSVLLNGANASTPDTRGGGGGAGGGLLITGEILDISGTVSANGGAGAAPLASANGGGGGGGGRLKAYVHDRIDFTGSTAVAGGAGACCGNVAQGQNGGAGTQYWDTIPGGIDWSMSALVSSQPAAITGGDTAVCQSSTATYTATVIPNHSYTWTVSGGNVTAGQGTNEIDVQWTNSGSGNLMLVTVSTLTGCSDTVNQTVNVSNVQPSVSFTANGNCVGQSVFFTNTSTISSGSIVSYSWDFDDGNTSTSTNPNHIYAGAGTYSVTLTATSAFGCSASTSNNVTIDPIPVAGFTATAVCPGVATVFTNTSSGAASYSWDFGDGNTSTAANPTNTYAAPGTYTVTLVAASINGCTNTISKSVTVYPLPVANFDIASACPDSLVQFTNTSGISSGSMTYSWDFGDGNTSISVNPAHAYVASGTYAVQLIATSNNSCVDTVSKSFSVYPKPSASFTTANVCDGDAVVFDNTSTISVGSMTYSWDFGDGNGSSNAEPTHVYSGPGVYNVTLTVLSDKGCMDLTSSMVEVFSTPVSSFTTSDVCDGTTVTFTNNSTTGIGINYNWDFGDGNTSTDVSPTHLYATSGTYTVTLSVSTINSCADISSTTVNVHPQPTAAFTGDSVCLGNAITFVNASTISLGSLNFSWDFGDAASSTTTNPSHTYATAGSYTVTLTAISNQGCTDVASAIVAVYAQPIASFTTSNECAGDTVMITNNSTTGPGVSYSWDFGDGNTSTSMTPKHLYAAPGTYTIMLAVSNNFGCTDTAYQAVTVHHKPLAAFSGANVCIGNVVQFTNTSSIGQGSLNYQWDFGDGQTSISTNPSHAYDTAGFYNVVLTTVSNTGCMDTAMRVIIVYPKPEPNFSFGAACYGENVTFTNLSTIDFGSMTYLWAFGDGNADTSANPVHAYSTLGAYDVVLTVTSDQGCMADTMQKITVRPEPKAAFMVQNECEGQALDFVNLSSISSGNINSFWDFGDNFTSIASEPGYTYMSYGDYNVQLNVTSDFGCKDSINKMLTVWPLPDVNYIYSNVCWGDTMAFKNATSIPNGQVYSYFWSFGDGQVSQETEPSHLYAVPGTYPVELRATSAKGCIDSLTQYAIVHELPDPTIRPFGPTEFCDGLSVELSAEGGAFMYEWSTGDTTQNIIVTESGIYTVTVASIFGCTDSDSIEVTAWPLPEADAGEDTTISKGYTAQLHGAGGEHYQWSPFETLSSEWGPEPIARPFETTEYVLTVTDTNGCKDTDSVTVFIDVDYLVQIPNLFTPNGDGVNDTWEIINILTYPDCEVLVFDRWGTQVFVQKGYQSDWDGTSKGKELPAGTYYYVVRFDGSDRLYKGAVSILR